MVVCVYVCVYIYMCVCVYICVCIYIYMDTHVLVWVYIVPKTNALSIKIQDPRLLLLSSTYQASKAVGLSSRRTSECEGLPKRRPQ